MNTDMHIIPGEPFFQDICVDFIEYWLWNHRISQLWAQNSKPSNISVDLKLKGLVLGIGILMTFF